MVLEENKTISKAPAGEFDSSDLEVGGVVVYRDRAEVKRLIRVSVKKGENDVVVNQLPSVIDPKSLRLVSTIVMTHEMVSDIAVCMTVVLSSFRPMISRAKINQSNDMELI